MSPTSRPRILIFVGDDYEDLELWYPKLRLEEFGGQVAIAGPASGHMYAGKHGYPCVSDAAIAEVQAKDFDGVVIPGGWMPDKLRRDPKVLELVRQFDAEGKLVASICHGPSINLSAGIVRGVKLTSSPGIKDDLVCAGAVWIDQPVVRDRHHITSRRPSDLPQFAASIVAYLPRG